MLRERVEKLLEECCEEREKAFERGVRFLEKGKFTATSDPFKQSNELTYMSEFLDFVLDEEDKRSFREWLNR